MNPSFLSPSLKEQSVVILPGVHVRFVANWVISQSNVETIFLNTIREMQLIIRMIIMLQDHVPLLVLLLLML
jgi:hypothetical protein